MLLGVALLSCIVFLGFMISPAQAGVWTWIDHDIHSASIILGYWQQGSASDMDEKNGNCYWVNDNYEDGGIEIAVTVRGAAHMSPKSYRFDSGFRIGAYGLPFTGYRTVQVNVYVWDYVDTEWDLVTYKVWIIGSGYASSELDYKSTANQPSRYRQISGGYVYMKYKAWIFSSWDGILAAFDAFDSKHYSYLPWG